MHIYSWTLHVYDILLELTELCGRYDKKISAYFFLRHGV